MRGLLGEALNRIGAPPLFSKRLEDRTFLISRESVYNRKAGCYRMKDAAPGGDAYELVCFIAESLTMSTGKDPVSGSLPCPDPSLSVTCVEFKTHRTADGDGIVIDRWSGEVLDVSGNGSVLLGSYSGACELAELLEDSGIFQRLPSSCSME